MASFIELLLESPDVSRKTADRFIFGSEREISKAALEVLNTPELAGDDFKYLGSGAGSDVVGNGKAVFKLIVFEHDAKDGIAEQEVPEKWATKLHKKGTCNGISYAIYEQLDTSRKPTLDEITAYLFALREDGLIYTDPKKANFGYDQQGNLKVLDLGHFAREQQSSITFEETLALAVDYTNGQQTPYITQDAKKTYVVLPPTKHDAQEQIRWFDSTIDAVRALELQSPMSTTRSRTGAFVTTIPASNATYGTPLSTEPMKNYLEAALNSRHYRNKATTQLSKKDPHSQFHR